MFEILFLVVISIYILQIVFFAIGARKKFPIVRDEELPHISIIVAARNEEDNILECMRSLDDVIYPSEKLEIIIVNDHSTDKTGYIIESFIQDKPKFKTIVPRPGTEKLKGKANAIDNAVELATGKVIVTTDADCSVSPTWAKTIASYYTEDTGIVCGYTTQVSDSFFGGMQMMDFIYLLTIAGGAMNFGNPNSCIGNNMSFRRSAYNDSGGYGKIPFSVTEDFKLLMEIFKLKKYKIIYPLDPDAIVTSKPCPDFKTLYEQKKRWGVGGLESNFTGYYVMAVGVITHICMILTVLFFSYQALFLIGVKTFADYFFVVTVCRKLRLKFQLKFFLVFEIYFIIYVIALPVILLASRKVKWKGREY